MIEIPSDLHPSLTPLAFLLGTWQGAGVVELPGQDTAHFGQELTFGHDGRDHLSFASRTWVLDSEGNTTRPLESEQGFWRLLPERQVEAVLVRDQGIAEVWYGELAEGRPQLDLATDAVARTPSAPEYSGGKRLYGYVKGDLMWVGEKATPTVPLRPYMSAHLKKSTDPRAGDAAAQDPAAWAGLGASKDLPDDGIAFFR